MLRFCRSTQLVLMCRGSGEPMIPRRGTPEQA
jgi:hypothetical protein